MSRMKERSPREISIIKKRWQFRSLEREVKMIEAENKKVPGALFQTFRIVDYWLAVNFEAWKSRLGYAHRLKSSLPTNKSPSF